MADDISSSAPTNTVKKYWADEQSDDEVTSPTDPLPSGSKDVEQSELNKIESLSISEDKSKDKDDDKDKDDSDGLLNSKDVKQSELNKIESLSISEDKGKGKDEDKDNNGGDGLLDSKDVKQSELNKIESLSISDDKGKDKDEDKDKDGGDGLLDSKDVEQSELNKIESLSISEGKGIDKDEDKDKDGGDVLLGGKDVEQSELNKIESLLISEDKGKDKDEDRYKDNGDGLLDNPEDSDIKAVTAGDTVYSSALSFEDLNLSKELLKGIYTEMRFQRPSKIQTISLPMILTPPYKDLVAQAHNGSGKTTCFVLGMLSRVDPNKNMPQAMCICPTRELALQNQEVLIKMGKFTGIKSFLAIPADSTSYVPISKLPPVTDQVVIGTPGTIKKWTSSRKLGTREIKILVFDEADHMLAEDGFRDDSLRIMKEIQSSSTMGCQVLLFSATFNDVVKAFVSRVVKEGNQIFVKKEDLTLDKVKQYKVYCPDELAKIEVIKNKIFEFGQKVGQTIIFAHTRNSARMLHQTLSNDGYECSAVQGSMKQEDRDSIIREFKEGITKVLITTDLLARGFDQSQVNLVINFDLPVNYVSQSEPDYEIYLHRIGRTGRFGRKGAAFNLLCTGRDRMLMEKIERHFNHTIPEVGNWQSDESFEKALKDAGLL